MVAQVINNYRKSDEKLIESSLTCINAILTRSTVNSQQTFTDLYRMLCVMLDHHQPPETSQLQQCMLYVQ